jgi:hypothetical protein
MKCQTDFGAETDVLLNQADECLEEWWEGEPQPANEPSKKVWEEVDSGLIARQEVRKRGLDRVAQEGGV